MAVIDNDSEDNLQHLIEKNSDIIECSTTLDYNGKFDLVKQLETKENVAQKVHADWFIHLDVDELLYSNERNTTIQEALSKADALGYNAVNFDEFVFLPIQRFKRFNSNNYHTMNWYYFFEPKPNRLIRAFKKGLKTQVKSGGHNVDGELRLYEENMIMRHYMFENRKHAKTKYRDRFYSQQDLENRFHGNRRILQNRQLYLPSKAKLLYCQKQDWQLDKSHPQNKHFWQW